MNRQSKLSEMMMAFFVSTACITILEGTMGMLFFPDEKLTYHAFFAPPIMGLCSVLFGFVTWSKRELTIKETLLRRGIHLLLIECLVFGLNYVEGIIFPFKVAISLILGIAVVFVAVYVVLWVNDSRSAKRFNKKLREYQKKVI
ncbi:MAG: DUF3021 family protein [Lachnospiraceae bacterium]|nr:DUF3021 family protein [Lachnospiraceae bacterium]